MICPILWNIAPIILTPIVDNLVKRWAKYIVITLRRPPLKLKKKTILNKPVLRIPTNKTLMTDKKIASLKP
jgi:hypothetical protein